MQTIEVKTELLNWAITRSRVTIDYLQKKFPKIKAWGKGTYPTFKQLEKLAKITYTPLGYFFLPKPPEDKLPISRLSYSERFTCSTAEPEFN